MIQDIKDRLPTKPNTWEVTHSDSTVEEVTVARADEPTEVGTPINSALFRNLQGDLYTIDRSVTPTATVDNGTVKLSVDVPLTSYETGKLIRLRMPSVNGTWAGDYIPYGRLGLEEITANTESATNSRWNAIDGNTSTYWAKSSDVSSGTAWIQLKFGTAIKIKKMKVRIVTSGSSYIPDGKIQGSNDGTSWTDLYTFSENISTLSEITLNNNLNYSYYRFIVGTGRTVNVYELQVTEYEGNVFWAYNPQINVNSLGWVSVNGMLRTGGDYLLRYNGAQWEMAQNPVVTGTFGITRNETITVNVGFKPKLVIIYSAMNNYSGVAVSDSSPRDYNIPIIITDQYSGHKVAITSTGFSITESGSPVAYTLYYVAIGG